jgi:hypothetical protein
MNTSTKCNCCCKEDVCGKKYEYLDDVERIKAAMLSPTTEVSIKCKYFSTFVRRSESGREDKP